MSRHCPERLYQAVRYPDGDDLSEHAIFMWTVLFQYQRTGSYVREGRPTTTPRMYDINHKLW